MNDHYYAENPTSEIKEKHFKYSIKNITLEFVSVSGVFSFEQKVDKASELLIENFTPTGSSVLDVGCGYGPIGLFIKAAFPAQKISMVDINNRAVDYTIINSKNNNLEVTALKSDLFSNLDGQKFDDIVSNPPIAAGKKLNTDLINQSFDHLNDGGALWIVAFHNKGGSTLKGIMESRYGNVEDVVKSGGVRVYKAVKGR